jgi:hypothetical protein
MIALDCVHALTPFPRKSHRLFLIRERTPPPKLPLTAILSLTRFTLIYPSCSGRSLAMSVPITQLRLAKRSGLHFLRQFTPDCSEYRSFPGSHAVHVQYIQTSLADDNRSLVAEHGGRSVLRQSLYQFIDLFNSVVKMRRDPQPITAGCGDDVSFLELRVKFH